MISFSISSLGKYDVYRDQHFIGVVKIRENGMMYYPTGQKDSKLYESFEAIKKDLEDLK